MAVKDLLKKPFARRAGDRPQTRRRMGSTGRHIAAVVAVALLLAVPPVFVNHPVGYLPLAFFLITAVICAVYLLVARRGFSFQAQEGSFTRVRSESASTALAVVNKSALPLFKVEIELMVLNPQGRTESHTFARTMVDAHGSAVLDPQVALTHIGMYQIQVKRVALYDPMGLFCCGAAAAGQTSIVSTPRIPQVDSVEFARLITRESESLQRSSVTDWADYAGCRDYELGDPIKSIHWKISARTENLQTRLFEVSHDSQTLVVVDFHAPDYEPEYLMQCVDIQVPIGLAVVRFALDQGIEANLAYAADADHRYVGEIPEGDDLENFVRVLPTASPVVDPACAASLVRGNTGLREAFDNVVVCASTLSQELTAAVLEMLSKRVSVVLVMAVPLDKKEDYRKDCARTASQLEAAGAAVLAVSDAFQLGVDEQ